MDLPGSCLELAGAPYSSLNLQSTCYTTFILPEYYRMAVISKTHGSTY